MGAIRKIRLNLPKRLHFKHGSFWYISQVDGKQIWENFGSDESAAIVKATTYNNLRKSEREKIFGIARSAEAELERKIMARDDYKCVYCGAKENLGLDHVIPHAQGGATSEFNLVVCCWPCNVKKGNSNPASLIIEILGARELIFRLAEKAVLG